MCNKCPTKLVLVKHTVGEGKVWYEKRVKFCSCPCSPNVVTPTLFNNLVCTLCEHIFMRGGE